MRLLTTVFLTIFLLGCEHTYEMQSSNTSTEKLKTSGSAYVALPNDGRFEHIGYYGSGMKTANATLMAFSPHLNNVVIGKEIENKDQALTTARDAAFTYLIYPEILH